MIVKQALNPVSTLMEPNKSEKLEYLRTTFIQKNNRTDILSTYLD